MTPKSLWSKFNAGWGWPDALPPEDAETTKAEKRASRKRRSSPDVAYHAKLLDAMRSDDTETVLSLLKRR